MRVASRSFLFRWFMLFTLLSAVLAALPACGRMTRGESLEVFLVLPEGVDPGQFWVGVESRSILVQKGNGEKTSFPFRGGALEVELKKGDRIEFRGVDGDGRVLVTGEANVGEEKRVSIPLRSALK